MFNNAKTELTVNNYNWDDILNKKFFEVLLKTNESARLDISVESPRRSGRSNYIARLYKLLQVLRLNTLVIVNTNEQLEHMKELARQYEINNMNIAVATPDSIRAAMRGKDINLVLIEDGNYFNYKNWFSIIDSYPFMGVIAFGTGDMKHTSVKKNFWSYFINKPSTINFFVTYATETVINNLNLINLIDKDKLERDFLIRDLLEL